MLSQDDTIRHPANFKRLSQLPRMPMLLHTLPVPDTTCPGHTVYHTPCVPDTPCTVHYLYRTLSVLFPRSEVRGLRSQVSGPWSRRTQVSRSLGLRLQSNYFRIWQSSENSDASWTRCCQAWGMGSSIPCPARPCKALRPIDIVIDTFIR